jgi:hypothetical protein
MHTMKDFLDIDTVLMEHAGGAGLGPVAGVRPAERASSGQELAANEPIDIYHWAAVTLVTALMCAVLGYAAGTPTLARAANVTSLVFGALGGVLTAAGVVRMLRARLVGVSALRRLMRAS